MKICLINPPLVTPADVTIPHSVFQPMGLAYIAAVLERSHDVTVIDAIAEGWRYKRVDGDRRILGLDFDEIRERIEELSPEIVGITVPFSMNASSALSTATAVKAVNRDIITVLGGPHPSIRPEETLSHQDVDFIVIGEGELTISELVREIECGQGRFIDIKGIGYMSNGRKVITGPRQLNEDLDSLPFPARHLLPMEEYYLSSKSSRVSRKLYNYNNKWASIFTSRGCPFNCSFCSIKLTMGKSYRKRSPENILKEIDLLVNEFGIRHINFEDDNLTLDKNRANEIFTLLAERDYKITWSTPNGIRADMVDEDMVMKMKASGCKRVFVAPESGVQRVVDRVIGKNLNLGKVEQAVRLFKKHSITVDGSFVLGSIGESKEEMISTIKFAKKLKKLGMNTAGFHIATPLYGTRLYEEAKQKNYLKKNMEDCFLSPRSPLIETPEWSGSDLLELLSTANWIVNYSFWKKIRLAAGKILNISEYKKYARRIQRVLSVNKPLQEIIR